MQITQDISFSINPWAVAVFIGTFLVLHLSLKKQLLSTKLAEGQYNA